MTWREKKAEYEAISTKKAQILVGATISSAKVVGHQDDCDGVNVLVIETDKGTFEVIGGYGGYTGKSCDEYYENIVVALVPTSEAK